jgi:hypothetical protein
MAEGHRTASFTAPVRGGTMVGRKDDEGAPLLRRVAKMNDGGHKWKDSMFFSEEKNQKTFVPALAQPIRPWPVSGDAVES